MRPSPFALLHIDDELNDLLLLRNAVEMAGLDWRLARAVNGAEAINYLQGNPPFSDRDQHPLPSLILLDLKMPFKNGFEVLEWIRQQAELRRILVVVFTSSNQQEDIKKAYDCGANSYVVKPVRLGELIELLKAMETYWVRFNQQVTF